MDMRLLLKQYEYSDMNKPFDYYFDKNDKMIRSINEKFKFYEDFS